MPRAVHLLDRAAARRAPPGGSPRPAQRRSPTRSATDWTSRRRCWRTCAGSGPQLGRGARTSGGPARALQAERAAFPHYRAALETLHAARPHLSLRKVQAGRPRGRGRAARGRGGRGAALPRLVPARCRRTAPAPRWGTVDERQLAPAGPRRRRSIGVCRRTRTAWLPAARSPGRDFGDFPVWRKDDCPSYQLACTVDDAMMGITEVVRGGEDLVRSTFQPAPHLLAPWGSTPPALSPLPAHDGRGRRASCEAPRLAQPCAGLPRAREATPQAIIAGWAERRRGEPVPNALRERAPPCLGRAESAGSKAPNGSPTLPPRHMKLTHPASSPLLAPHGGTPAAPRTVQDLGAHGTLSSNVAPKGLGDRQARTRRTAASRITLTPPAGVNARAHPQPVLRPQGPPAPVKAGAGQGEVRGASEPQVGRLSRSRRRRTSASLKPALAGLQLRLLLRVSRTPPGRQARRRRTTSRMVATVGIVHVTDDLLMVVGISCDDEKGADFAAGIRRPSSSREHRRQEVRPRPVERDRAPPPDQGWRRRL